MIKAEELMIGNYVYKVYPDGKEIVQVEKISNQFINGLGISGIKPIPLTEEWLIKFGFKHTGNGFYDFIGTQLSLCNIGNKFLNSGYKGKTIREIYFVHQLQNLFYALTGEKLTIKKQ